MDAYEAAIAATAAPHAPWYVVPANNKWFTRLVVVEAMIDALEALDLKPMEMQAPGPHPAGGSAAADGGGSAVSRGALLRWPTAFRYGLLAPASPAPVGMARRFDDASGCGQGDSKQENQRDHAGHTALLINSDGQPASGPRGASTLIFLQRPLPYSDANLAGFSTKHGCTVAGDTIPACRSTSHAEAMIWVAATAFPPRRAPDGLPPTRAAAASMLYRGHAPTGLCVFAN